MICSTGPSPCDAFGRSRAMSANKKKLPRVARLLAVVALFATTPQRVERLFFTRELKSRVAEFCAVLAGARNPLRLVGSDEVARGGYGAAWRCGCDGGTATAWHRARCRRGGLGARRSAAALAGRHRQLAQPWGDRADGGVLWRVVHRAFGSSGTGSAIPRELPRCRRRPRILRPSIKRAFHRLCSETPSKPPRGRRRRGGRAAPRTAATIGSRRLRWFWPMKRMACQAVPSQPASTGLLYPAGAPYSRSTSRQVRKF